LHPHRGIPLSPHPGRAPPPAAGRRDHPPGQPPPDPRHLPALFQLSDLRGAGADAPSGGDREDRPRLVTLDPLQGPRGTPRRPGTRRGPSAQPLNTPSPAPPPLLLPRPAPIFAFRAEWP